MPYINKEDRELYDDVIDTLAYKLDSCSWDEGHINYVITRLLKEAWAFRRRYSMINRVIGAIECAKLEFYRRVAVPYEDEKIEENGDV